MRALAVLGWLIVGIGAWLPTVDVSKSSNETINTDNTNKTVSVASYIDLNACSCNRVHDVCDYQCCCDSFCNKDLVAQWKKNGVCKSEFVEAMRSFFCDETILAVTPKLREMNTCRQHSNSVAFPQHLLHRVFKRWHGSKCLHWPSDYYQSFHQRLLQDSSRIGFRFVQKNSSRWCFNCQKLEV